MFVLIKIKIQIRLLGLGPFMSNHAWLQMNGTVASSRQPKPGNTVKSQTRRLRSGGQLTAPRDGRQKDRRADRVWLEQGGR